MCVCVSTRMCVHVRTDSGPCSEKGSVDWYTALYVLQSTGSQEKRPGEAGENGFVASSTNRKSSKLRDQSWEELEWVALKTKPQWLLHMSMHGSQLPVASHQPASVTGWLKTSRLWPGDGESSNIRPDKLYRYTCIHIVDGWKEQFSSPPHFILSSIVYISQQKSFKQYTISLWLWFSFLLVNDYEKSVFPYTFTRNSIKWYR